MNKALASVARRLVTAPPDSRLGRLAGQLRAAVREEAIAAGNEKEFQDLTEHERMLADGVRVDAYAAAIRREIRVDDVVLDLGTGTGILSFMAARRAKKVYAVDHGEIIDVAKAVGGANGFSNIEYIRANSRDFSPPEPVDVILHEQIGDELFDENMVANIVDLRERVMRPGGRILPSQFELYLEPVRLHDDYSIPFIWQMNVHDIDFGVLKTGNNDASRKEDVRWVHRLEVDHFLCDPEPIYHLDLATAEVDQLPSVFHFEKTVTKPGRLDGLFLYFRVIFDDQTSLQTSPDVATSWHNRMFQVPSAELERGEKIEFHVDVPDVRTVREWTLTMLKPV